MRLNEDLRPAILTEARSWLGTPFHHQAALKGVGCDCAGLVRGVGQACGVLDIPPERWAPWAAYGRAPHPERMRAAMEEFLAPIAAEEASIGDVCWLHWREGLPMHLAILGDLDGRSTIVHALIDNEKVVEHGFTKEWRDRVTSWWRFPGLAK